MADAAEEDFDLHVVFGWIAPRDRGGGQRRCRTGSGVSFRLVHGFDAPIGFLVAWSGLILFVADLFHPVDGLAVELFLDGDVRHAAVAPCQCFSPGGNQITSPGRISSTGPPQRCTQPQPAVTI